MSFRRRRKRAGSLLTLPSLGPYPSMVTKTISISSSYLHHQSSFQNQHDPKAAAGEKSEEKKDWLAVPEEHSEMARKRKKKNRKNPGEGERGRRPGQSGAAGRGGVVQCTRRTRHLGSSGRNKIRLACASSSLPPDRLSTLLPARRLLGDQDSTALTPALRSSPPRACRRWRWTTSRGPPPPRWPRRPPPTPRTAGRRCPTPSATASSSSLPAPRRPIWRCRPTARQASSTQSRSALRSATARCSSSSPPGRPTSTTRGSPLPPATPTTSARTRPRHRARRGSRRSRRSPR
jgi:hypothetical protein